ncbi:MAG: GFA family protein, partial [Steroidobacteraceae bacterium]
MPTGSCLCGVVRWEVSAPYQWMGHCHCSMCRKHHGSLFASNVG